MGTSSIFKRMKKEPRTIIFPIIFILIISAIGMTVYFTYKNKNKKANEIFAVAYNMYRMASLPDQYSSAIGQFNIIENNYGSSDAAPASYFYSGICYLDIKDYVSAIDQFNKLTENYKKDFFYYPGILNKGFALESNKDYSAAIEQFNKIIEDNHYLKYEALIHKALCLEKTNNIEAAKDIYNKLIKDQKNNDDIKNTIWTTFAEHRLNFLLFHSQEIIDENSSEANP